MTAIDQRLATALGRTRRLWATMMVVLLLITLFMFPWWFIFFLIPLGIASYLTAMTATLMFMANRLREENEELERRIPIADIEQISKDIDSGDLQGGSSELYERLKAIGLSNIAPIGEFSEEIVGYYDGHTMYEWVEVVNPYTHQLLRFHYHSPSQYDPYGAPILPEEPGKIFAHVQGVIYCREKDETWQGDVKHLQPD